ncbi:MAG TPA: HAD family hydrolase [Umezawaea sp.]|nr:HAD family hydrolase [Umezawaea sp.]
MTSRSPQVMSFDVTGTLAEITGPSHTQRLVALSPLPAQDVRRILHDVTGLKTLPSRDALTPALVRRTCAALQIDVADFGFGSVPLVPYRLLPGARNAVTAAAHHGQVVAITNTSVFADDCLEALRDEFTPHLTDIHPSLRLGVAKPDPRIFHAVASRYGVDAQDLVHVGDRWDEDIAPVLALGGHAVWITTDDHVASACGHPGSDRLLIVRTLEDVAAAMTRRWWA